MWAQRNNASGKVLPAESEIPASAIDLTEGSGARMSELTPLFLANQGGMVLTTAHDYGTLHAAGRPG
jgi:hypothetical protein